jgi:tetratricopeptide (TPR) repeat protein
MLGVNFKGLYNNASKLKNSKSMAEMQTRAINAYQTAVEMNSKLSDGWIALGEIFEEKKDKKALNYYENAILSNPSYMPAHHAKAYYLQNNGDVAQAKSIYRSIIINDPNYTDALKNLGYLYMAEDSLDKAFEQFNTLAGVAPTNHLGFYMRGIIQERQGKVNEALKDYQSAYNLKSDDKDVEYALNKLKSKIK